MRGQRHSPTAIYSRERPGRHCTEGWVGPRSGLDSCGKSRPHRDSIPDLYIHIPVSYYTPESLVGTSSLITENETSDMNHFCIRQMSYLFLFSPSGAQSNKPRIFIVTFYDRSFSSAAAASLLLRPFSPSSSSFCIIVLPCANYPLFLVPRYFSSFLLPLYFLIFPIVMLLVLLWNCTIKSGHFVSSKKDRTQTLCESKPFASRQEKEKFEGDVFYPSLTCELQACNQKGRRTWGFILQY